MNAHQRLLSIITALVVTAGASPAADAKPLRIGYNIWVGFGPLFVAQEKGLFAQEGIEVELILGSRRGGNLGTGMFSSSHRRRRA